MKLQYMKRLLIILACLSASLSILAAQKDTLRVLAVGNSFSVDAVNQNLFEIAASDGKCVIIGNLYIGGCPLEKHWNNAKSNASAYTYYQIKEDGVLKSIKNCDMKTAIGDEPWDVVTFQQSSPLSGKPESYEPYLGKLYKFIRKRVPKDAKFYFHQTWAYSADAVHKNFPDYGCNQKGMYDAIMNASKTACDRYGFTVIPSGTAIQNVRGTWDRDNVTRDGYHLSLTIGRYTAALTWYETLSGTDARTIRYKAPNLPEDRAEVARGAAHAAVLSPYATTKLGFTVSPENKDESLVPEYTLPDPLTMQDGTPVKTREQWFGQRRPELVSLFETYEYGKVPGAGNDISYSVLFEGKCLGGRAKIKEVRIGYCKKDKNRGINLLVITPADAEGPVPMFMGPNFRGNHAVFADKHLPAPQRGQLSRYGRYELLPSGANAHRWPVDMIIASGYGLATFFMGDTDPDFDDSFQNGVQPLFYRKGQTCPAPDEWGSIGAWAWGLSRAMDYLETDPAVDASKVAVIGHSRLGKTALWAAALDQRFAMCISNESGCSGAALSRRCFGETLEAIQHAFPHWFCSNYRQFIGKENELPFDQHELLALIAPRPLYVASASLDLHADPHGEFLSAQEASKVYEFLGARGLVSDGNMPPVNTPLMEGDIAYHIRAGLHDINAFDWAQYIKFADKYFK